MKAHEFNRWMRKQDALAGLLKNWDTKLGEKSHIAYHKTNPPPRKNTYNNHRKKNHSLPHKKKKKKKKRIPPKDNP
ncbi:MAG TPA: hypothetical protein DCF33_09945, partial [Saprospirales bacterium]|nr:hypothetical protein [Saprospirales bacterium]